MVMTRRWALIVVLLFFCALLQQVRANSEHGHGLEDEWWRHIVEYEKTEQLVDFEQFKGGFDKHEDAVREFWAISPNLAAFSSLNSIKYVTMPHVINVVFVGFEGDGNQGKRRLDEDLMKTKT